MSLTGWRYVVCIALYRARSLVLPPGQDQMARRGGFDAHIIPVSTRGDTEVYTLADGAVVYAEGHVVISSNASSMQYLQHKLVTADVSPPPARRFGSWIELAVEHIACHNPVLYGVACLGMPRTCPFMGKLQCKQGTQA